MYPLPAYFSKSLLVRCHRLQVYYVYLAAQYHVIKIEIYLDGYVFSFNTYLLIEL